MARCSPAPTIAPPALMPGVVTVTDTVPLLDVVMMPGIDGLELLRKLREKGSTVPVIVMTGHADVQMAVEAMKNGAVDFIEKPFDDDIMLGAIQRALTQQTSSETARAE